MSLSTLTTTAGQGVLDSASRFVDRRDRQLKRRSIRKQLAECERRDTRRRELQDAIAVLDRESDTAAAAHSKATEPLQDKLAAVEAEIVEHLTNREPVPSATEERRKGLLDELLAENTALEQELDTLKSRKNVLQKEINALHKNVTATVETCHSKLCSEALANRDLFHAHFASEQAEKFARARLQHARKEYQRWSSLAEKVSAGKLRVSDESLYARRGDKWGHELDLAHVAHEAAVAAQQTAREAMLNE